MTMRRSGDSSILAPIRCRNRASSSTSGSVAALRITVLPSARAADSRRRLGGAHARVGQLDDGPPEAAAAGPDPLVGHLYLRAQGLEGLDVEVDRPPADPVAANQGHERFAREVQQRTEQAGPGSG